MTPDEGAIPLSPSAREALRERVAGGFSPWYSPWAHLAAPSLVGLSLTFASLGMLRALRAWELATVVVVFVFANALEWSLHRGLLHRRRRFLPVAYDRHTPIHHRIFVTDDMAIRSTREFGMVLIPAYGIVLAASFVVPVAAGIAWLGQRNVALLFVATCMIYIVLYEWLHLSYHAPKESWVGRLRLVEKLRRHHALHHAPELMQRWNFNVTVPLWDWVRGTLWHGARRPQRLADGPVPRT